jgi:hypothetical protein
MGATRLPVAELVPHHNHHPVTKLTLIKKRKKQRQKSLLNYVYVKLFLDKNRMAPTLYHKIFHKYAGVFC